MASADRFPSFDLTGKIALVTGAGRGMGAHMARSLAHCGAVLILLSRTRGELERVAEEIRAMGRRALIQAVDLTRLDLLEDVVARSEAELGPIDILVNNAGINFPQPAEDVTLEKWEQIHAINLKAPFFLSQAVGRRMIDRKRGKIIMISSQAGRVGIEGRSAYGATKAGIDQLTRNLAIEWAPYNIQVNAVAPTFVEGPFTAPMFKDPEFKRSVLDRIPLGRVAKPDDISGAVVFLASGASDMVTGSVLTVDGGWTAQ